MLTSDMECTFDDKISQGNHKAQSFNRMIVEMRTYKELLEVNTKYTTTSLHT